MSLTKINFDSVKNELKNIKLIATDIDGTLTKNGQFSSQLLSSLETLKQQNILVLLITGRSAGWCQGLVNYLPVWGIIAENGGVYALKEYQSMKPLTTINDLIKHRQLLQNNFEEIRQQFPHLQPSSDNQFRVTDWTFDCHFIYHLSFIIYHSFGSRLETSPKLLLRGRERLETKMKDVQCSMFNVQCFVIFKDILNPLIKIKLMD